MLGLEPVYLFSNGGLDANWLDKHGVPTITIGSDFDGAAKDGAGYRSMYTGAYEHRVLDGIGHNVPQEAPAQFANAIIDVSRM